MRGLLLLCVPSPSFSPSFVWLFAKCFLYGGGYSVLQSHSPFKFYHRHHIRHYAHIDSLHSRIHIYQQRWRWHRLYRYHYISSTQVMYVFAQRCPKSSMPKIDRSFYYHGRSLIVWVFSTRIMVQDKLSSITERMAARSFCDIFKCMYWASPHSKGDFSLHSSNKFALPLTCETTANWS